MNELIRRIKILWDGLEPRERVLVAIAGGGIAMVLLLFGVVMPVMGATQSATARSEEAERQLDLMQRMRRDWDSLNGRLGAVEQKIQSSADGQNLLTLLESLAARAGVKPTSMEKRQSGESERYEESKVEVSLKGVSLQQAIFYLESIERESQPLSIKSLRIKSRPGHSTAADQTVAELIDVTFSVSSFKPR